MTKLPEIIDLFTKLASHLHQNIEEESSCRVAISLLNESLNFNQRSRVRVLDTALSLMCFKSPEICNSAIEYLVDTVVSVLVSSVSCNVTRLDKGELVQIGSSISSVDVPKLICAFVEVLEGLEGYGMLSHKLLLAVLKVATSASCYQSLSPISSVVCGESSDNIKTAVPKLHRILLEETSVNEHEPPIRLLLWFIDPSTLKHDVSKILREAVQRPFLCLKKEFHERKSWRLILICLVTSPTMFMEARALLHNWFILTGLASIQDLKIELVSSALDLLSRPMWWGMSMELGSMLPFSNAYFPNKHYKLFSTLAGPISCESFLDLVQLIGEPIAPTRKHSNPTMFHPSSHGMFRQTPSNSTMIDHKSSWALLMDFPAWFYFAAMLLFCEKNFQDIFLSKCSSGAVETERTHDLELHRSAARYLAWILNPINETHCGLLVDCITEISDSWTLKHKADSSYQRRTYSDTHHNNDTAGCGRKLKKLKIDSSKKDLKAINGLVGPAVGPWLEDFHDHYVNYYNKRVMGKASSGTKATSVATSQPTLLFRKILLGILIGCSSHLREEGHELLLHYAATGSILLPRESRNSGTKHVKQKFKGYNTDDSSSKIVDERDERKGAVAGASLVFNLFDTVEDLVGSMIECEDSQLDFICRAKGRASSYLVKCIKKILQLQPGEDEDTVMLMDLQRRLARWRRQGREVFEGYEAFDDLISAFDLP